MNKKKDIRTYYSSEEFLAIQQAYQHVLDAIKIDIDADDRALIQKAYELAVISHVSQRRKSGEPYVMHPIEVARICVEEMGLGPVAITCALLHDVVEDTPVTLEEIEAQFNPQIAKIVDGLTKLDGSYKTDSPQAENFKKVLSTLVEDVRVVLVKMADRLHNMRTLGAMPRHKQLRIAAETSYIFAPLAHRLGLYNVKTEFEELCMRVTDTEIYFDIAQKLEETQKDRNKYIETFIKALKENLKDLEYPFRITGRPKSIYSIWNKLKTKKVGFDEIYDKFAIRLVIDVPPEKEKAACWQVYSSITNDFRPIPERIRDWISVPKANGYESLHTTVIGPQGKFVEIQIRSERMDEIAERGFAAHWKYKGINTASGNYEIWLDNVREILESPSNDAVEFLNDFKTNLFDEEIYVFTPKGEMKILPKGATALDFAFSIHSEVGCQAKAIKVNNKLVPMGFKLKNGDQVQVITSKTQKPSENWLKVVVTGRARSKIRWAMKEERRKIGLFGKETLQRKFKNLKLDYEENVEFLVSHFGYQSRVDLFYDIASEKFNLSTELKAFDISAGRLVEKPKESPLTETSTQKEKDSTKEKQEKYRTKSDILINGEPANTYQYQLATCCSPVYGDPIFAYLTAGGGIKIHRTGCPNATNLMAKYGYRVMKANWVSNPNASFVANLLITGVDDGPGVVESIMNKISTQLRLNIRGLSIDSGEGYFEGKISIYVSSTDQLKEAINGILQIETVSSVTRVK